MDLLIDSALALVIPGGIGLLLIAALVARKGQGAKPTLLTQAAVAAGLGLGIVVAFRLLQGRLPFDWDGDRAPGQDWLALATVVGAGLGIVDCMVRERLPVNLQRARYLLLVPTAYAILNPMLAGQSPATHQLWLISSGAAAVWAALDLVALRLDPRLTVGFVVLLIFGAAGVLGNAHVASYAQLLAGGGAALVGAGLATAVGRNPGFAAAIPAVALMTVTAVWGGHFYADLSLTGAWLVIAAPVVGAVFVLAPAVRLRLLAVPGLLAVIAAAATLGISEPPAPADGTIDKAIDDAYEGFDLGGESPGYDYSAGGGTTDG